MSTSEERTKILNMVAEGKINAQEAASLLKALQNNQNNSPHANAEGNTSAPRTLHVRVTHPETGKVRANVSLPMNLVDVGIRMGAKFAPDLEGLDLNEIMTNIRNGARGKILEISDEDGSERVEIFVE